MVPGGRRDTTRGSRGHTRAHGTHSSQTNLTTIPTHQCAPAWPRDDKGTGTDMSVRDRPECVGTTHSALIGHHSPRPDVPRHSARSRRWTLDRSVCRYVYCCHSVTSYSLQQNARLRTGERRDHFALDGPAARGCSARPVTTSDMQRQLLRRARTHAGPGRNPLAVLHIKATHA